MKNLARLNILVLVLVFLFSCSSNVEYSIDVKEVSPWCKVGFDSLDRTPKERIAMRRNRDAAKAEINAIGPIGDCGNTRVRCKHKK